VTTTSTPEALSTTTTTAPNGRRPSKLRRTAVVAAGLVASVPALVWGVNTVVQMATGTEADHLFHQVTGQGLLLSALWLGAIWPLVVAGWQGRRPGAAAALHTLGFAAAGVTAAVMAPVAGAPVVAGFTAVTVALLWWALPARPRLRALRPALDPVAAAVVAVLAWLHVTWAVSESAVQRAMADEHATMAHNFDMAWVSLSLVVCAVAAVLVPGTRRLLLVAGLGSVLIGASRFLITGETWWSLAVTVVGAATLILGMTRHRERATR
jgi:hypothetical protein